MTTVETRVVNPVNNTSAVESAEVAETSMVDDALHHAEERMLGDEEIDSCEGEDFEDRILTVALVKSVVESGHHSPASDGTETARYGLRKRRRPGDDSGVEDQATEHTQATFALHQSGNSVPDPMKLPLSAQLSAASLGSGARVSNQTSHRKTKEPPGGGPPGGAGSKGSANVQTMYDGGSATNMEAPRLLPVPASAVSIQPGSSLSHLPTLPGSITQQAAAQRNTIPIVAKPDPKRSTSAKATKRPATRKSSKSHKSKKVTVAPTVNVAAGEPHLRDELATASSSVPNPLSSAPDLSILPRTVAQAKNESQTAINHPTVPCPLPGSVPCPLGPDTPGSMPEPSVSNIGSMPEPSVSNIAAVTVPPHPPGRGRIFSVDLDPSTFDFTDMASDYADGDKSEHNDIPDPTSSYDLTIFQRDRAFSFEVFNFSGDDLLPPPPAPITHSSSSELPGHPDTPEPAAAPVMTRPRGDSIIFDPVSFQDGGIHEKNALLKVKASNLDGPPEGLLADSRLAAPQPDPETMEEPIANTPNPLPAYSMDPETPPTRSPLPPPPSTPPTTNSEIATLPSALNNNVTNASSPATFQMELLNKDGRIGIYLPEARKQRIARFHAKRKMRIWRKRIKYDCRKKLADSRPRIKGRFVKRSDMDDE